MRTEIVKVSPELASRWLAGMGQNRTLKDGRVMQYAFAMERGEWRLATVSRIQFDAEGRLRNGQHRCAAVVQCGLTVPMYVDFDVPEADLAVVDVNAVRTVADTETMRGETKASPKVAACRVMALLEWGWHTAFGPETYRAVRDALGAIHVNAIIEPYSRQQLTSPAAAALIYARPLDPAMVDRVATGIVALRSGTPFKDDLPLSTMNALASALCRGGRQADQLTEIKKVMRGVELVLCARGISKLMPTDDGYNWLKARRRSMGLVELVAPPRKPRFSQNAKNKRKNSV